MGHKAQSVATADEYVCMGQEVQEICPVAAVHTLERSAGNAATTVAVPVLEPAAQLVHAAVETVLIVAMAHAVHVVAPVAVSVLVMDPATQAVQLADPAEGWYVPAAQAVAPRQLLVAVPLLLHDVDPPLVVTRYDPAGACVHDPPL